MWINKITDQLLRIRYLTGNRPKRIYSSKVELQSDKLDWRIASNGYHLRYN